MEEKSDLVTLVVRHSVKPSARHDYESWLKKIGPERARFSGYLAANVIRPSGGSGSYTVVLRFDHRENLSRWLASEARKRFIQDAQSFLEAAEEIEHQTGPEFWFTPETPPHPRPKPYKQFLLSLSAIYPLILAVPWALQPLFTAVPGLAHPLAAKLLTAVIVVLLMVYLIMPRYSRWLGAWLLR